MGHAAGALLLRQNNRCFREVVPVKALATAVTLRLAFLFQGPSILWTDREGGKTIEVSEAADLRNRRWLAEDDLPPDLRGDQEITGRQFKANSERFKRQDRRRSLASGKYQQSIWN